MKKILFVISIFALLFLISCSESMEYTSTTYSANQNPIFKYSFTDFEFSNISEFDLLYYLIDDTEDMKLMIKHAKEIGLILSLLESNNGIIDTLDIISEASSKDISNLLEYSATELNELAIANDIVLTVDDIVGFIDLLKVSEELPQSISFYRVDYLKLVLGRQLTQEEETGFTDFQDAYTALYYNSEYDVTNKTFLEIVDDLDSLLSEVVYTQELLDSIEIGYDIFMEIMD